MAVAEVTLVVTALGRQSTGAARAMFERGSSGIVAAVLILAIAVVVSGSAANLLPTLRWYVAGREPTAVQQAAALNIASRQILLLGSVWFLSAAIILFANRDTGMQVVLLVLPAVFFGAIAAVLTSLLLTVRMLRPITAATVQAGTSRDTAPGVMVRLLSVWVLISVLPSLGIAALIVARHHGWIIDRSTSVEVPVLILLAVALAWGLRAMILVSRSISDPVHEVADAMADVGRGNLDHTVDVYERSEIGRLQSGFNRMVSGLQERDRLQDLFGRNVGPDVVRLLMDRDDTIYGDVRSVSIVFIDLTGSTQLAATRSPKAVADVLNTFFQTVVAVVDDHGGFVNKFQGDAALAVFGAPVASRTAPADALATARSLAARVRQLPDLDFGVGISTGPVFAGFVGAWNRFEYTVIGDPVNEAARLADLAKGHPGRVLASGTALAGAPAEEQRRWRSEGSVTVRGRTVPTDISAPVD